MKPPALAQKQPLRGIDRVSTPDQMRQGRDVRSLRVTALLWLFQLLRIPEQYEAASGGGTRQHVRQRHLPGFVHEQNVDGIHEVLSRPKPSRAPENVDATLLQLA